MTILLSRRQSLAGGLLALPVLAGISGVGHAADDNSGETQLAALESKHPGRICVSILDMASGKRVEHRAGERILMCSTFKALLALWCWRVSIRAKKDWIGVFAIRKAIS